MRTSKNSTQRTSRGSCPSFTVRVSAALFLAGLAAARVCPANEEAATSLLTSAPTGELSESLRREARAAVDRGHRWLIDHQAEDGHWSEPTHPALTGLAVWALALGRNPDSPPVRRGIGFIRSNAREDGSIWCPPTVDRPGGGLSNYNTAICVIALHAANDPALRATVDAARRFLAGSQHTGEDPYRGGMGYDAASDRPYADLSNSALGYEAMALTRRLKDLQGDSPQADLDWEAAIAFVESLQNEDGGFFYKPGESKAGAATNTVGEVAFRSYGSMTYAGLLSLIYAEVDRDDPRVQSAVDWAVAHWTLEENPGMGQEGLYYFYNVLTKALAAHGRDVLSTADGSTLAWRPAIVERLLSLQRIDEQGRGYWQNLEGRWWEQDPVLVTAYALIALQVALGPEPPETAGRR